MIAWRKDAGSMTASATTTITGPLSSEELDELAFYQRAVNYLAGAQLYLQDNFLLTKPLRPEDIKERLLGHWGTCPGINLIYSHLNRLIRRNDLDLFLVTGPGHGAPANLANLYLEGTLGDYYPELTLDYDGLARFIHRFSWPGGFPSHLYPGIPGTIHEGGELGYSLATAYGAVMDNPNLIVACIVGDGEAETGPMATAWHSNKFLDPEESGAVLPILHLNNYKIASPTIFGTMSDEELIDLFTGYGYQPRFVQGDAAVDVNQLNQSLAATFDWALETIHSIQQVARQGQRIIPPRWPLIILRTPKGMTGIKEMDHLPIAGTWRAHQIPVTDPLTNPAHLQLIEEWLRSYRPDELFPAGKPHPAILAQCPRGDHRMGSNPYTFGGRIRQKLNRPNINDFAVPLNGSRGVAHVSSLEQTGKYLAALIQATPHQFRIFSPDELESNKLEAVLTQTHRGYQWPLHSQDVGIGHNDGRLLEILSEHTCQAWLQGYVLTGRYGLFPSYEAFLNIVTSMMDQFAKFIKMSEEFSWRLPVPSLNYLETSTLWRQEHNGFSHQDPGFLNAILNKKGRIMRVYLPPDSNCLLSTIDHVLNSTNYVNLVIANKPPMLQWLTMDEAVAHCRAGASIWHWASTDDGVNPDVVLVGIGDSPTLEVMAAANELLSMVPELRLRVVNVTDLLILENNSEHPHGLDDGLFANLFTENSPVIINFHGYPSAVKQLLFGRQNAHRFIINGYTEEGTTTTPFDMNVRNGTSRYHLIMQALRAAARTNPRVAVRATGLIEHYSYELEHHRRYIEEHGVDPEPIANWHWGAH
jgi:xylulose-5-phosphate/fructose-6-phosphate phosphoketolase